MAVNWLAQWRRTFALPIIILIIIATAASAQAQTTVWATSAADSGPGSLRQAIADAAPGDTVRLGPELSFRTITIASPLIVDKDLTIEGSGAPGVTISGNDATRIFDIGNDGATCGITVTLRAVRLAHGIQSTGNGAAILTCASTLTVELVTFEDNLANSGGGIHQAAGNVIVRDSAFTSNSGTHGSAVDAQGSGSLILDRVSITDNTGVTVLRLATPIVGILNSTIHGNITFYDSTIRIGAATSATMQNVTIAANSSTNPTSQNQITLATIDNGGTLEVENSIISNTRNCSGNAPVNLGSNLASGFDPCGFPTTDPQLGTLGYYGSRIVQTVPIAETSPARNAGNNAACFNKDGRSAQRAINVSDGCDIGAFEYKGPLTATVTNLNDSGAGSLRQAIVDIGYGGTIDFQAGLTGEITLQTALPTLRAMTIAGPGHATLAIARNTAAGSFRLLETSPGSFCRDMAITIKGLTFRDGDVNGGNGGAIYNCANLSVEDARFTNNLGQLGTAIYTEGQSRLKLERVQIESSSSSGLGALYAGSNVYHAVILDSSFDGANANVQFDSIHSGLLRNVTVVSPDVSSVVTQGWRTALEHVTLNGNVGFLAAGGAPLNPVSIANSIVIGTGFGACIVSGPHYESRGGNVFQGACAALAADSSNIAASPQLGAFALHAPGVVKTQSLMIGSAAIDRGNPAYCLAADARGVTRPQGAACDAGAFEAHIITLAPAALPQVTAGTPLNVTFTQTGAIGAATFASSGPLPTGLTLAPNGVMTGTPAAGTHPLVITVTDSTGVGAQQSYTLIVDGAPTVTGLIDRSVTRNGVLGPLTFNVGDDLTNAAALTIVASSSNQALVPDAGLTFGGSGAERTLTIAPIAGASGTAIITVSVSDGTLTRTSTFNVIVMPVYYLAEGATGTFFDLDLLIANPNATPAPVDIKFLLNGGGTVSYQRTIAPTSRVTIAVDDIAGLEAAAVSSVVTSTSGLPLIVERTMRWDATGYGSHTEAATQGAAPVWYFAEGAQGFFSTFILLANPNDEATDAHVTYFREGTDPLTRDYSVPALSRMTINAGADPALEGHAFGARVTFDRPGIAERAMYFSVYNSGQLSGGHASAGVTSPSTSWFLAEGATGSYFTTFLLLSNPQATPTTATLTYLPSSGVPVTRTVDVPALGRTTINIALEDASLADAAVATRVESILPIVVERSQYWPSPVWHEAHNSFGATAAATRWGLAEGRVGFANRWQTYILLANPGTDPTEATITFLRENGTTLVKTFAVPPTSRVNVALTGADSIVPELVDEMFGAVIESTLPIVVERSIYNNANGVVWAAGANAVATRLP